MWPYWIRGTVSYTAHYGVNFRSAYETLQCFHSNESQWAIFLWSTVCETLMNKYIFQWLKWFKTPFKRLSCYLSYRVQTDDLLLDSFVHSCNRWCQNISLSMQEYTSRTLKNLSFHPAKVPENRNTDIFSKRLRAADYLCIWRIILLRKAKIEKTLIQFCTDL